jgi:membrane associated rhomboid family serine protease
LITIGLILVNIYFFVRQIYLGPDLDEFISQYAVIPAYFLDLRYSALSDISAKALSLVSSLFLHGGWLHLIGNMWYLWIFGDNVEDRFGHFGFLLFYIFCGIAGNFAHIAMNAGSNLPAIGASGCIAGILGAYFLLFPKAKIVALLPIFIFWTLVEIPAFFFLGIWFLIQSLTGYYTSKTAGFTNVAWWAHIGGFLSGFFLKFIFVKSK